MNNGKKLICLTIIGLVLSAAVFAGAPQMESQKWSGNTAFVLPEKRVEVGLFQPLRYGFSEQLEFSMHPLLFFVMPNIDLKWAHGTKGSFALASRHGITYPTPLLRLLAKEGIGGLISPEFEIPHIFSFQNELLASTSVFDNHMFTGKIGVNLGLRSGEIDSRTTIDLPIVFARTSLYYNDFGLNFGGDMQGPLFKKVDYLVDVDVFYYPTADADVNCTIEHKGLLTWKKSASFQLCLGYMLSYGEYPFGDQWHLLPLFDVQWGWKR